MTPSQQHSLNQPVSREQVAALLAELHNSDTDGRDRAVSTLKALDRVPLIDRLSSMLNSADLNLRCDAAEASLRVDAHQTIDLVLPLLSDHDSTVRWNTCGLMHDFGDKRAIPPLVKLLRTDPDGDVRHIAAYALDAIGDESALPALRQALVSDDGTDHWGNPIREVVADAIESILARQLPQHEEGTLREQSD